MKRNYELDFWKFVFTIVIIIFHTKKFISTTGNPLLLQKGYLGVEFFFMVSGYLMMSGIISAKKKGKDISTMSFIGKKIKAFFPPIFFAFLVNFFVWVIAVRPMRFDNGLIAFLFSLPELAFLKFSGVNFGTHFYNGPSWYISAMLVGMFVLYPIAKKYEKKFACYIAPVIAVVLYSWITNSSLGRGMNVTDAWLEFINGGLARSIAGLCVGSTIYYVTSTIKNSPRQLNKAGNITFGVVEGILVFGIYLFMRCFATKRYGNANDAIAVFFIIMLLILVLSKNYDFNKFFGSKPMLFLYKLSLPLFLNQRVAIYYLNEKCAFMSFSQILCWYLGVTLALALISIPASKGIEKLGAKIWNSITAVKE